MAISNAEIGGGTGVSERWSSALVNVTELGSSLESLQRLLLDKAVYMDEEAFAQASAKSHQTRIIKAKERRIQTLERELDSAVLAASHARAERKQAEVAQHAAEARTQQAIQELEDTTKVFTLHMEELRSKQQELEKKDAEIEVLKAIINSLSQGKRSKKAS
ncbi:unnamed protein product [Sphagnum troendelagicum]|jgi:chromosome segregation ATPase|uniref:Uncharacterized protein n=3 Tax=Sphagnum TaxID=13804 RepID=A0ABP0VEW3_9BRYO|nr:hypothetical protein BDL97_10G036800 [Sphagnum fallax]